VKGGQSGHAGTAEQQINKPEGGVVVVVVVVVVVICTVDV
jgi:hypothetical protein